MILVDTPVWSFALCRQAANLSAPERRSSQLLDSFIREGRVQLLGAVRQELLSGLREEPQFLRLRDYLRDFPDPPLETEDYEEAARASHRCRNAGIATSSVDMLMCAVAIRRRWEIFTPDQDFMRYQTALKVHLLLRS